MPPVFELLDRAPLQPLIRPADTQGVLLQSGETSEPRPGHTVTALDDPLTRAVGRLPMTAALLLAGAVYAGVGLALPLALDAHGLQLISLNVLGVLSGLALILAWLFPLTQAVHRRHLLEWTTHLRLLSATEFEWLVGELLRREGWEVDETGREDAADGNVDLRIRKRDREMVVQCKRWTTNPVGVSEVRELAGTVAREQLPRGAGVLVTLSHFTGQAVAEAAQLELELVDNRDSVPSARAGGRDRPGSTGPSLSRRRTRARSARPRCCSTTRRTAGGSTARATATGARASSTSVPIRRRRSNFCALPSGTADGRGRPRNAGHRRQGAHSSYGLRTAWTGRTTRGPAREENLT